MTLATDTTLGPYQIESLIGRGGMGEVYRARDTRLNRNVAIKVLPASFVNDAGRVARFEREAKLLATLSHHHIAGIYGLETIDAVRFLVLELVEGETLAERLAHGALPVEESLRLCRQMADGVAAAHERGVLHRDLKPSNIKINSDDEVKILDFGIAKAFDTGDAAGRLANAETITGSNHTAAGTVVGTPFYMSPEQARGKPLDKRTDIWSFGCVIYECLVGRTAFGGETATDAIAKILEREPDYAALPAHTPPTVKLLLHRCLQKDRQKRLHDIRDARLAIDEAIVDPTGTTLGLAASSLEIAGTSRGRWLPWLLTAVFAVVAAGALWNLWNWGNRTPRPVAATHLALVTTDVKIDWSYFVFDLSPDGRTLVFTARQSAPELASETREQLFVRSFDRDVSAPITGTEGAFNPVFSPSGKWIAFLADDQSSPPNRALKRVRLDGTPPVTIADRVDPDFWSTIWLSDDTLLLRGWDGETVLATVPVDGGNPERIQWDASSLGAYVNFSITAVLPGGVTALGAGFRQSGTGMKADTLLISLATWTGRTLIENASQPSYTTSGHLVFVRDRVLMAAPFDPATGSTLGSVTPLIPGVGGYRLSQSHALVYYPLAASYVGRRLFAVDAQGRTAPLSPVKKAFSNSLAASADGTCLAVSVGDYFENGRIWHYDTRTDAIRPITPAEVACYSPCLSADGRQLAYTQWESAGCSLMIRPVDNPAEPRMLLSVRLAANWVMPACWSPNGRFLLVESADNSNADVLRLPVEGGEPIPILASSDYEWAPRISPDGALLAYLTQESGLTNLYVCAIDEQGTTLGARRRVTSMVSLNSTCLWWSPDGGAIHYLDANRRLMAAAVTANPALAVSEPRSVLDIDTLRSADDAFTPLSDGRFAFIRKGDEETEAEHLNVVLNWDAELDAKAPLQKASSR